MLISYQVLTQQIVAAGKENSLDLPFYMGKNDFIRLVGVYPTLKNPQFT
jgi:hypothetical protein